LLRISLLFSLVSHETTETLQAEKAIKTRKEIELHMRFWKKEKPEKDFQASLIIDNPDIKMLIARFEDQPFFFAVGVSEQRLTEVEAEAGLTGGKAGYRSGKGLIWYLRYNPKVLRDFVPFEKSKELMANVTSAVSGSMSVYDTRTDFQPIAKDEDIEYFRRFVQREQERERLEKEFESLRKQWQEHY
jgi:hypothetical protein